MVARSVAIHRQLFLTRLSTSTPPRPIHTCPTCGGGSLDARDAEWRSLLTSTASTPLGGCTERRLMIWLFLMTRPFRACGGCSSTESCGAVPGQAFSASYSIWRPSVLFRCPCYLGQ